jgi:enoyl-CoA hydratase/carnithine racemase
MTESIHNQTNSETGNQDKCVICEISHGIAQVKFNRLKKHNALDMPMFYEIKKTIKLLKKNKNVRVVIVSGLGKSFCSGLDIKAVMQNKLSALKLLWKWWPSQANLAQQVTVGWRKLDVPVIMAIHGKCWGGGMQIALGGDYRIAKKNASLAIMESHWGLIPDMGGTVALSENMPVDQAMKLAMIADPVSAEFALKNHLITQVSDDPHADALILAEQLMQRSPDTNKAIKKLYHKIWARREGKILAAETFNQWKIVFGKNRQVAIKKAMGNTDAEYQ